MEYYADIKRNEIWPFATMWMELEGIMLSEIKSVRERQVSHDLSDMKNLRGKMGVLGVEERNEIRRDGEGDKP